MKKILLATTIIFSGTAYADNGFYASLKAGISNNHLDNNEVFGNNSGTEYWIEQHDSNDNVYPNISAAIGFDFSNISKVNVRTELEYSYKDKATYEPDTISQTEGSNITYFKDMKFFKNEVSTQSLMLNTYYDFKNATRFTPYLSAGLGIAQIKNTFKIGDDFTPDNGLTIKNETNNNFVWSVGAGVSYNVTNNTALDLGYRYIDFGEIKVAGVYEPSVVNVTIPLKNVADLTSSEYSLGIRYSF